MQLNQDHDDLRRLTREFARAMNAANPDMADISRRRIAFSQLFRQYLIRKQELVATVRLKTTSVQVENTLRAHADGTRDLFLLYNAHIKVWTPDRIAGDWPGYRTAVLSLQRQLNERLEWEETTLHPLAVATVEAA
tara:strand:- start:596 stop:1003 length:408 start_codon:yes stop_codon:yes gene_type:complete